MPVWQLQDVQRAVESAASEAAALAAGGYGAGGPLCAPVRHLGWLGEADAGHGPPR